MSGRREAKIRAEKINEEKGLKRETEAWERGKKRGGKREITEEEED